MLIRAQFPGIIGQGRLGVVTNPRRGLQELVAPNAIIVDENTTGEPYIVVPEAGFGGDRAPTPLQQAYQHIRQHPQLSLLAEPKALRTLAASKR